MRVYELRAAESTLIRHIVNTVVNRPHDGFRGRL